MAFKAQEGPVIPVEVYVKRKQDTSYLFYFAKYDREEWVDSIFLAFGELPEVGKTVVVHIATKWVAGHLSFITQTDARADDGTFENEPSEPVPYQPSVGEFPIPDQSVRFASRAEAFAAMAANKAAEARDEDPNKED